MTTRSTLSAYTESGASSAPCCPGVFASKEISGADGSVLTQLWGVGTTLIYGLVVSFIILKVIDMTMGLRVTEEQEREGWDISLHGERIE
jgi:Amt family ammonium transporter